MNIAIVGGTFDPPHIGHKNIILRSTEIFDKVLVIPNQTPAYKNANIATDEERLKMCQIMCEKTGNAEVLSLEVDKNEFNYTYFTILELLESYPSSKFTLVIGTDNFLNFEKWYEFEKILKICNICVFKRSNDCVLEHKSYLEKKYNANVTTLNNEIIEISSTKLRNKMNSSFLDEKVLEFINKNEIYGV